MGMNVKVITLQPDMQAMFENLLKDAIYKQVDRSGCLHIHMVLEHLAIKQITSLRYFNLPVWVPLGDLFKEKELVQVGVKHRQTWLACLPPPCHLSPWPAAAASGPRPEVTKIKLSRVSPQFKIMIDGFKNLGNSMSAYNVQFLK